MDSFWRSAKRFSRALVSILIAGTAVYFGKDEKYILLAPVVSGIGKYLRDKLGLKNVPF